MRSLTIAIIVTSLSTGPLVASDSYIISSDSIYKHISVLAHDSLEGRQVGEAGELKAAQYIKSIFKQAKLEPMGDDGSFFQSFGFIKRIDLGPRTSLTINGTELKLREEFLPLKKSGSMPFDITEIVDVGYGITVKEEDGTYDDYERRDVSGKGVLVRRFSPSADTYPHVNFDRYNSLTDKIKLAQQNGAVGLFFITPEDQDDTLLSIAPSYLNPEKIPVIWIRLAALNKLGLDLTDPDIVSAYGETEMVRTRDTGYNVVGYIPTGNDTTVIIGAHYDHLGYGGSSSLYRGKKREIHNGADDNASGTAGLLELARQYSSVRERLKYSMLFIAFSGEEAGILGSSYYAKHMTVDSSKVRMMINMDMIGRLKDQESGLAVFGTGTCNEFKDYFDSLKRDDMTLVFREPGTGPSDHTAFYNRKIPSLHFFTGAHNDYHKPSDDIELIDTAGVVLVTGLISEIVDHFDNYQGSLTFQKTKDAGEGRRRSQFSVTLGVMPDYVAEVQGLRIDAVTPDRPGERAGIIEGDILIRMGEIEVGDIYDYMSALGKFRKGDSTILVIVRGTDTLSLPVLFE